jgi:hypothetical protein
MGQVNDLERMGREVEVTDLDNATRSRIELTMKKPACMPVPERKSEARLEVPPHLSLDDHGDVLSQPAVGPVAEAEPEPAPMITEGATPVEAPAPIAAAETVPEAPAAPTTVEEPAMVASGVPQHRVTSMPQFVPGGLLAMGLGVYALDIYVISAGILNGALAWGISILASLLMVYAVIRYLPMITRGKRKEDEAVLCPVCHEMVSDNDSKCPSCGVRFKEAPSRE